MFDNTAIHLHTHAQDTMKHTYVRCTHTLLLLFISEKKDILSHLFSCANFYSHVLHNFRYIVAKAFCCRDKGWRITRPSTTTTAIMSKDEYDTITLRRWCWWWWWWWCCPMWFGKEQREWSSIERFGAWWLAKILNVHICLCMRTCVCKCMYVEFKVPFILLLALSYVAVVDFFSFAPFCNLTKTPMGR